jgi:alpha-beta hydrolase superfamily lysophospholipase
MKSLWFLILFLLLVACRPSGQAATAAPTPAAGEETVAIPAADGLSLVGTFYTGPGEGTRPGVLLLHMLGSNRGAWSDFVPRLVKAGCAVLALGLRGHGDTGGASDWTQAPDDVLRAWQYLAQRPEVDGDNTAVVGASIGANLALTTGAAEPRVKTVVLLSPGLDYRGVTTADAMAAYDDRPVLIVASGEDNYAADSSRTLSDLAVSQDVQLQMYDGAGHGTNMFRPQPALADLILGWLGRHLAFLR